MSTPLTELIGAFRSRSVSTIEEHEVKLLDIAYLLEQIYYEVLFGNEEIKDHESDEDIVCDFLAVLNDIQTASYRMKSVVLRDKARKNK